MTSRGQDIEDRLVTFAVRIVNLCDSLSESRARNHIGGQLLRSGTAPASHYAEARNAESDNDFILCRIFGASVAKVKARRANKL